MNFGGVRTKAVPHGVDETVRRLIRILDEGDFTIFMIVDHSSEAAAVGLDMPNTKVVIFGDPAGGTPAMLAQPLLALALPLKLLVWEDTRGATWINYNTADYLATRHDPMPDKVKPLAAIETIADALTTS